MMNYVFLFALILWFSVPTVVHAWSGYVVKVLDGDSLQVKKDGKIIEIRLYGIDCPEWKQPYGNEARRYSTKRIYRKTVTVEPKDIDRYGRIVALVSYSGRQINRELVSAGWAWMYPKYCREQPLCSEFKMLQDKAEKAGRGLWQAETPVSPWQWKWNNK